ncbi:MAG: hypothetical protein ACXWLM_01125 [Myxococcales bacterium]
MNGRRIAVPLLHAGLALLVLPWFRAHPFSGPKLWLLAASAVGLAFFGLRDRARAPWLPLALALSWLFFARGGPLLDAAAALLLLALLFFRWDGEALLKWLPWIGAAMASVVLAQAVLPGPRLRMFGTLGNPDFCAAWLGAGLCVALRGMCTSCTIRTTRAPNCTSCTTRTGPRGLGLLPAALQAAALLAIGSFGTVLALAAAALVGLRSRRALGAVAAGALCIAAAGRDPARVLEGRIELHRIALPHLLDAPLRGLGPGSVEALYSEKQNHVHDDWLERAIEQGIPAALSLALLAALGIAAAVKRRPEVAAALASLCARACVDFPLARPAELALFVTLIALSLKEEDPCPASS